MVRTKGLPNARAMEIMFEGTVATGKKCMDPVDEKLLTNV